MSLSRKQLANLLHKKIVKHSAQKTGYAVKPSEKTPTDIIITCENTMRHDDIVTAIHYAIKDLEKDYGHEELKIYDFVLEHEGKPFPMRSWLKQQQ